jgi:hypothetical protein
MQYIYLLQEREFIRLNENVYKIGKTKQENVERLKSYPKGSSLVIMLECVNCDKAEHSLINIFKSKFRQRTDIGTEYFEGNKIKMRSEIIQYFDALEAKNNEAITQEVKTQAEYIKTTNDDPKVEENSTTVTETKGGKYYCSQCDFYSNNKYNFLKHYETQKHNNDSNATISQYSCQKCNRQFSSHSGFWKHNKKCTATNQDNLNFNQCLDYLKLKHDAQLKHDQQRHEAEMKENEQRHSILKLAIEFCMKNQAPK